MERDRITVVYGEQVFAPVPYNTFRLGPFTMETQVREGETDEQAMARAYACLESFARSQYVQVRNEFMIRYRGGETTLT